MYPISSTCRFSHPQPPPRSLSLTAAVRSTLHTPVSNAPDRYTPHKRSIKRVYSKRAGRYARLSGDSRVTVGSVYSPSPGVGHAGARGQWCQWWRQCGTEGSPAPPLGEGWLNMEAPFRGIPGQGGSIWAILHCTTLCGMQNAGGGCSHPSESNCVTGMHIKCW